MPHKQPVDAYGFSEVIAMLFANGESGRLDVVAGGNEGALLFNGGKLVDARLGHLTGFQAINALASMRDAHFQFDRSAAVPAVSSITPSERLVLRQFFGIETADTHNVSAPVLVESVPAAVEPVEEVNEPVEAAAIYSAAPRFRYLVLGALAVLLVAVIAGAVVLREKFRARNSPAAETSLATRTEPASAPAVATPAKTEESGVTEQPRIAKQPRIAEQPRVTKEAVAATPNLTGEWSVVNTVNTTSYQSFQNLRIGFAVSINQTGTTFTARGRKVSENGRTLPANSRTPIELKGVINGDHIEATFSEQGSQRKTNGRFVWKIDRAGGLTGTFASSAARTSGKSTATREL
jgi:hypothetical protein